MPLCVKDWTEAMLAYGDTGEVYRYFDDKLQLVYVGLARDFTRRAMQHNASARWAKLGMVASVHEYGSYRIAKLVEAWAQRDENPPHCVKHEPCFMPREYVPEPPEPTWYFTGGYGARLMDAPPYLDEDGILVLPMDGDLMCLEAQL